MGWKTPATLFSAHSNSSFLLASHLSPKQRIHRSTRQTLSVSLDPPSSVWPPPQWISLHHSEWTGPQSSKCRVARLEITLHELHSDFELGCKLIHTRLVRKGKLSRSIRPNDFILLLPRDMHKPGLRLERMKVSLGPESLQSACRMSSAFYLTFQKVYLHLVWALLAWRLLMLI